MKVSKTELAYALKKIGAAVGKDNKLVKLEVSDKILALTTYDGKGVQMQQVLSAEKISEKDAGKVWVTPYDRFNSIVQFWKGETVSFKESGGLLSLEEGRTVMSVPVAGSMPELSIEGLEAGSVAAFSQEELYKGLKQMLPIVEKSSAFDGVYFEPVKEEAHGFASADGTAPEAKPLACNVWGTDGTRVHKFSVSAPIDGPFYIPVAAIKVIAGLKGMLQFVTMGGYLVVKDEENTICIFSLLNKQFPLESLKKTLAASISDSVASCEAPASEFLSALALIAAASTDEGKRVIFSFAQGNALAVGLEDAAGKGRTEIIGTFDCTEEKFSPKYNSDFVAALIASCSTDTVHLKFAKNLMILVEKDEPVYVVCSYR